jgi:transcriptional regulator of met regulon
MSREARRLTDLVSQFDAPAKKAEPKSRSKLVANPEHGEKGDFVRCTITLPPEVYKILNDEAGRRKMAKEKNSQISAIIREAVVAMLSR